MVKESNLKKTDLISKIGLNPDDKNIIKGLMSEQEKYLINYKKALKVYKEIRKKESQREIFLFPNIENFLYTLGIGVFLIYSSCSFILFFINRKSNDKLYLLSTKIKMGTILFFGSIFCFYVFYPKLDFDKNTYILYMFILVGFSLYSSYAISMYFQNLQKEIRFEQTNLVRLINLLDRMKNKYLFPFAKKALESDNKSDELIIKDEIKKLDSDIKTTLKSIS